MPRYVDGYVLPVPKKKIQAYRRIAQKAGRVWRDHGALEVRECVGDDLKVKMGVAFPRSARVKPGETVVHEGVTIVGPLNIGATLSHHASQLYAKNVITFLLHLLGKEGAKQPKLPIDVSDEITRETLLTHDGAVVHPRVKELLG